MTLRPPPITVCYKQILGGEFSRIPILLDIYLPPYPIAQPAGSHALSLPAVIYFHGGGLTVGNRQSWFPTWLYKRVLALKYAFICADYQLLPAASAHDIVADVKDLFAFLFKTEMKATNDQTFKVDTKRIAVSGSSAGGACAYLAAMHCSPRPRALISMYGMAGNLLIPHYLCLKEKIFFRGRELLDPSDFSEYLYPFKDSDEGLLPITDSPLAYHPQTYHIPGYPANPRMLLCRLYMQLGKLLDYWTGMHEPSLTKILREILDQSEDGQVTSQGTLEAAIPEKHKDIFPQFRVSSDWPPTMLLHGTADSAVLFEESAHLKTLLEQVKVAVELFAFEGKEHSFDYEEDAEEIWVKEFNSVKDFLFKHLEV